MSADLHIHVLEGATEDDLSEFLAPIREHTGAKDPVLKRIASTPNVWIGAVSWLKATLLEDSETYIPDTVAEISDIIGEELPIIDDDLIKKVVGAFTLPNRTIKEGGVWDGKGYALANPDDIRTFLESHKGKKAFTISW